MGDYILWNSHPARSKISRRCI